MPLILACNRIESQFFLKFDSLNPGKLIIVPTPVGNLKDITFRALEALEQSDAVLAEDTRTTGNLLKHYRIDVPLIPYHQHNEHKVTMQLVADMQKGKQYALVSDAGTPGINDAAFFLIRESVRNDIAVETLPGPTAFVPALVSSGLPTDRFVYEGFLPVKKGRQTALQALAEETRTMIFYESPYRLVKTLGELAEIMGNDRPACVSREISKKFEEHKRGTLDELKQHYTQKAAKGEIVLIVGGKQKVKQKKQDADDSVI